MRRLLFEKGYFWKQLGFEGLDDEEFKKRTTAVQLAIFTGVCGAVYCGVYIILGFPNVVYGVSTYVIVCTANLLYLRFTHHYNGFGIIQLALIFLFPLICQLTIGGFIESSAVILAAFLAPAGALLYASKKVARICFYVFMVVIAAAAVWEHYYAANDHVLPRGIIVFFFASNTIMICAIVYFLLESFLKKQEELRVELRESLHNLRTTQSQLIQAEKMASLGQLTAGIAHEIQNPLNFVNNFSELNMELTEELEQEIKNENADPELVRELVTDLIENQKKIIHHGGRAAGIIKGMLEHSRSGDGQLELTNINNLAEEFLHLAYHGQRAKDSTFNVRLTQNFAPDLPEINVIPQDLGRVILNLLNNAFYAVRKKAAEGLPDFEPTVGIATKQISQHIHITVTDNGTGIPDDVRSNIFQPFFTTKPTGEGTGLGLSLSYDIITGGHNGHFQVESTLGKGTEIVIVLPVKK